MNSSTRMNLGINHQSLTWKLLGTNTDDELPWPFKASLVLLSPDRIDQDYQYNDQPIVPMIRTRFETYLQQNLEVGEKLLFNTELEEWMLVLLRSPHQTRSVADKLRLELSQSGLLSVQGKALSCSFAVSFFEHPDHIQQAVEELQAMLLQAKLNGPASLVCSLRQPSN